MTDRIADALRLRTWAIGVLASGWTAPPEGDSLAWRLFLKAERCAVALSIRTEGDAPPLLHAAATIELQRILSARAQLEQLGWLADQAGERIIVLKGGLMALGSPVGVDLLDIDVLAESRGAPRIAALLDARGYLTDGSGSTAHLPQRRQPFAVHIEIHHSVTELPAEEMWERARPVTGRPGLWTPAGVDQIWHALVHSTVTHGFRRGVLRDSLLIGWADDGTSGEERSALEQRIEGHPAKRLLRDVLRLARDLRDGRAPVDGFRREAAAHYLLAWGSRAGSEWGLRPLLARSVFSMFDGEVARKAYWRSVWTGSSPTSPWPILARVEALWPAAGRILRRALRLARLPLVEALALPIALRAVRLGQPAPTTDAKTLDIRSGEP